MPALLFKCIKRGGSRCIVLNAFTVNPVESCRYSVSGSPALRTPGGGASITLRACAEPRQREAANQSVRGVSSPRWCLCFSSGVKTIRMTLQLMAPHIYSHEVGSIRPLKPTTLITTKHLFSHFVHSRVSHILTRSDSCNCQLGAGVGADRECK